MASVSSHGGTPPPSPRNGSTSAGPSWRDAAVRGGERLEDAVEAPDVLAEALGDGVGRGARQLDAARRRLGGDPGLAVAGPRRRRGVARRRAGGLGGVGQRLGQPAAAADEHELGRGQRIGQVGDERGDVVGAEAPDVAEHDDAPLGEERRRLGGVDDGADLDVVAVELVDHQRPVAVADQLVDELGDRGPQDRLVVAGQQVHGHRSHHRSASRRLPNTATLIDGQHEHDPADGRPRRRRLEAGGHGGDGVDPAGCPSRPGATTTGARTGTAPASRHAGRP